jgi:hypothetical protein
MTTNNLIFLFSGILLFSARGAHALGNSLISQGVKATTTPTSSATQSQLENFINQGVIEEVPAPKDSESKASTKDTTGQRILLRAFKQIGYAENPLGSNCNKFSIYFGKGCQTWCADFVSWSFDLNGNKQLPWGNVSAVSSIHDWGKASGHIVKVPRPGDIFILEGSGQSHTGIVRSASGSTFTTVEGNTSNSVRSLKRSIQSYTHFVRVP